MLLKANVLKVLLNRNQSICLLEIMSAIDCVTDFVEVR